MKIKGIEAQNFRNLKDIKLDFGDVNIIYGENAQGKTNLLEAIYLFTGSKSFRGAKDADLISFGSEFARLSIDFESDGREQNAALFIDGKRHASLNGIKKKSPAALGEEIKAVIFSPVHLSMIKDGPAERRKFIDGALCQIKSNYFTVMKNYNRSLQQRNAVLKDISTCADLRDMLYIWDAALAKDGAKIIYQRQKYAEAILPFAKEFMPGFRAAEKNLSFQLRANLITKIYRLAKLKKSCEKFLMKSKTMILFSI